MAAKTFQFAGDAVVKYGPPIVSRRRRWEHAWVSEPTAIPLEAVWSAPPTLPTAALLWRYGPVLLPGYPSWINVEKDELLLRGFVKLQFPMTWTKNTETAKWEWNYRTWYGIVDVVEDDLGGGTFRTTKSGTTVVASGQQLFTCYGLEKLLADHTIAGSYKNDDGTAVLVNRPIAFNRAARPNRSAATIDGTYVFEEDLTVARWWSTRDIVDYLLARQVPRDATLNIKVPFKAAGVALPDWDKPEVSQENATTFSLLAALINRSQMLSFRLTVDESTTPDTVHVHVFSLAEAEIALPLSGDPKIPANTRQKSLQFDRDPLTRAALKAGGAGKVDQVRVKGARKRSVGSFSFADGTLVAGWDSTLQSLYDAGASTAADYDDLDDEEKRARDAAVRGQPRFDEVYAFFKPPVGWDRRVKNGEAGSANALFPNAAGLNTAVFLGDTFVEPTLPLIQGIDYSTDKIATGSPGVTEFTTAVNLEEMPPMVFFKRPETSKWIAGDKLGLGGELARGFGADGGNSTLSVSVDVPHESQGVILRVQGDPQHAIAPTDFAPLDVDELLGGLNWRAAIVTWSYVWEHVEGVYPTALSDELDCVRVKEIDAGDRYRADYVAPGTVVGVDDAGALVRSTGGWIPKEGSDDDKTKLEAIAKLAFSWYGSDHYVLSIDTHRFMSADDLDVGDLITEIGDQAATGGHRQTVNTTVSQIRLAWPESAGTVPQPPLLQIVTDCGELDPIQPGAGLGPRDAGAEMLPAATLDPSAAAGLS